jgi:hypothetical protein
MPISTFLNGRAVTRSRGLQWLSFSDVITIQTPTATSDSGGGGTIAWQTAGTTTGRIYPVTIRGKGGIVGGALNERSTHFLSMPPATSINTADRVLIAGRGTFEVTMALETTDALSTRVEVIQV